MNQVTMSGTTGPGITFTTKTIQGVTALNLDFQEDVVTVVYSENNTIKRFDMSLDGRTAVVTTISGGAYTVVIS